jgi:uncharacterized protein (DUF924 family)
MPESRDVTTILDFWFGQLDGDGLADEAHKQRWWRKDPAFDGAIRDRFAADHAACVAGARGDWLTSPRRRLAFVIVLDQFSRNMFRDTPPMFAADPLALEVALRGIDRAEDISLRTAERVFLYMPLMHSESPALQARCVALFRAFSRSLTGQARKQVEDNVGYAIRHRDIVDRFGRFPHRNAILGRTSTPEELSFLKEPGSSF